MPLKANDCHNHLKLKIKAQICYFLLFLSVFFVKIDELDGVRGEIVCAGREYNLCFEACSCALHRAGCVNTPMLCECSRQSVLYVMSELWPDRKFGVEVRASILRGADECVLNITVG